LKNGIQILGMGMDPGVHRGDDKAQIPAFAGMTEEKSVSTSLRKSTKQADETANRLITAKVFWKFDFLLPPAVTLNLHGG